MRSVDLSALCNRIAHRGHDGIARQVRLACERSDGGGLAALFHPDIVVIADVGGTTFATGEPVRGIGAATGLLLRILAPDRDLAIEERPVNGSTGLVLRQLDTVIGVVGFDIRSRLVRGVWIVLNPDKLSHWNRR